MATLQDLRDDVRSRIDEVTPAFWTPEEVDRAINEALRDVARRTETLQSIKSYDVSPGKQTYDAPHDQLRIHRVEYRSSSSYVIPLEFQPFHAIDNLWWSNPSSGGTPRWWTYWGTPGVESSQLYLFPVPSETISDGLRVFYYRLPAPLSDPRTKAELPVGWEDLIPLYAEHVARRKDNDSRWREAYDLYESRLKDLMMVTRQPSDQAGTMSFDAWHAGASWLGAGDWD